ncbi:hypothetical protein ONZ51_g6843 [Trametes cubensis]|uniref:F-box domain-containing protein n=1 Tax=Trametes cubensis TaxID=1111947 RepID=A0AAD7TRL4_9APHY|nr:hypothetical protein ONZ51_g6843 [Trametes cubensis]
MASATSLEVDGSVARLPDDVLCELFRLIYDALQHENAFYPDFVRLLHVCRRWRLIALSMPTLWREVHTNGHPDRLLFFLTHSADLPKDIHIETALFPAQGLSLLTPFLPIIRLLDLSFDLMSSDEFTTLWESPLISLFSNDFPGLESLILSVAGDERSEEYKRDLHLRACRMPRLQSLDVTCLVVPSDLCGLRHFRADTCMWAMGPPELITLLHRCPDMGTVELSYVQWWPDEQAETTPIGSRAYMPRLERLTLLGPIYDNVVLKPDLEGEVFEYSDIRYLLSPTSPNHRILPQLSSPARATLNDSLGQYELVCANARQSIELQLSSHDIKAIPGPTFPSLLRDLMCFTAHSSRFITELNLVSGFVEHVPRAAWSDVFRAFDHLEKLYFVVAQEGSLLDMWAGMEDATSARPAHEVCCPNLSYIRAYWVLRLSLVDRGEPELAAMKLALRMRAERGAPLDELFLVAWFDEDGLTDRATKELSPYVTNAHATTYPF